jgi:hypothetical protein
VPFLRRPINEYNFVKFLLFSSALATMQNKLNLDMEMLMNLMRTAIGGGNGTPPTASRESAGDQSNSSRTNQTSSQSSNSNEEGVSR